MRQLSTSNNIVEVGHTDPSCVQVAGFRRIPSQAAFSCPGRSFFELDPVKPEERRRASGIRMGHMGGQVSLPSYKASRDVFAAPGRGRGIPSILDEAF